MATRCHTAHAPVPRHCRHRHDRDWTRGVAVCGCVALRGAKLDDHGTLAGQVMQGFLRLRGSLATARMRAGSRSIAAGLVIACNGWPVMQTIGDDLPPPLVIGAGGAGLLACLAIVPLRALNETLADPQRDALRPRGRSSQGQPL